jgi:carbon storage regulator
MLVLSRQPGEKILIGDNIEITVVGISGGKVKIGIEAPRTVNIKRKELEDQVRAANIESSALGPNDLPTEGPSDVPPPGPIGARPNDVPPKPPRAEGPGKDPKDRPDGKDRNRPA